MFVFLMHTMPLKKIDVWDCFALHTWLILSSMGIIFGILSFLEESGCIDKIKNNPSLKGIISLTVGIKFYIFIGLRHIEGAKKRQKKPKVVNV